MSKFESFADLRLPSQLAKSLVAMNFTHPTPVQAAAIPAALAGKDILATAQTGTGKTAAFGIPLLALLVENTKKDALILVPTRELAAQIQSVLQTLSQGQKIYGSLIVGGESFHRQAAELRKGADYIVATPGRLNDHIEQGTIDLSRIAYLVLDEVDRMLDMGFAPQIKRVMQHVPDERQTLLFSATLPDAIKSFAASFLTDPLRVEIGAISTPAPQVTEQTIATTNEGKNALIVSELGKRKGRVIVFTRTKSRADRLEKLLYGKGHDVVTLHGGRTQEQRKRALDRFRKGTHRVLVATDLAGRGIDVVDIQHVINYDVPATREDYVHRIGRTGRCGKTGSALNFLVSGDFEGERVLSGQPAAAPRVVFRSRHRAVRR